MRGFLGEPSSRERFFQ